MRFVIVWIQCFQYPASVKGVCKSQAVVGNGIGSSHTPVCEFTHQLLFEHFFYIQKQVLSCRYRDIIFTETAFTCCKSDNTSFFGLQEFSVNCLVLTDYPSALVMSNIKNSVLIFTEFKYLHDLVFFIHYIRIQNFVYKLSI